MPVVPLLAHFCESKSHSQQTSKGVFLSLQLKLPSPPRAISLEPSVPVSSSFHVRFLEPTSKNGRLNLRPELEAREWISPMNNGQLQHPDFFDWLLMLVILLCNERNRIALPGFPVMNRYRPEQFSQTQQKVSLRVLKTFRSVCM
jgi:hypothetical protein